MMQQLSLFPSIDRIRKLLKCRDKPLLNAISLAVTNFCTLPKNQAYSINFSGGKDSHVILGIYLLYLKLGYSQLNINVGFADTKIEHHSLYQVIDKAKEWCESNQLKFLTVYSPKSYWFVQYAYGYPVPDFRIRWCTGKLKVQPLKKIKTIPITGRHLGESIARDNRIKRDYCGTNECGTDKLKAFEPIIHFRNCTVWDCLFYFDGIVLYKGCFDLLKQTYKQAGDSKNGSLRMGCFMCPVIAVNTLKKNLENELIDVSALEIRLHLEKLRQAKRINNQKTNKRGAIYVVDRRNNWKTLNKDYLLTNNWITEDDIKQITTALESDYAYPPTYKKEWIDLQHAQIENSTTQKKD